MSDETMKAWHENDDFWETMAPCLFPRRRWEEAFQEVEAILRLTAIPQGSAVLDLCCGPGRHALELARRGLVVTAVDRMAPYLGRAGDQAKKEGLSVELIQEDMRRFKRPGAFRLALSLYTSFGYFQDPQDDLRVARNLCESLEPSGRLVMELMGREVLTRIFRSRDWQPVEGGGFFLEERFPSPDWTWVENRWILIQDGQAKEHRISLRLYGAADLSQLLREADFRSVDVFGSLQGAPYDHLAKRLVILASK